MIIFTLILAGFVVTTVLTYLIRNYALKLDIMDRPNSRSSHTSPTPRGGGLSIAISFQILILVNFLYDLLELHYAACLSIPGLLVATVGFIDDHRSLHLSYRLLVHFLASILTIYLLPDLPALQLGNVVFSSPWVLLPLLTLCLVWLLNLFNFMDGIDGIAGTEAITVIFSATTILYLQADSQWEYLLLPFSASVMGFLVWNWEPATIFLGDVGSGFLGFIIGVIALITSTSSVLNLWTWMILLAAFITDATWTLVVRILTNQKWLLAHRSHAYQIISRTRKSHAGVSRYVAIINLSWLAPIAFFASKQPEIGWALTILAYAPLIYICWLVKAGKS